MSEPRIYSRNYVDKYCSFSPTHGGNVIYLFDGYANTVYSTTGANSDSTQTTIFIDFYSDSLPVNRQIDTIIMKNYNFKSWSIEYRDGTNWILLSYQTTDIQNNRHITFSPVSTQRIRIDATTTKTPNEEKKIGELIVCNTTLDVGSDMSSYDPKWRERVKDIVLGDGSLHKVYVKDASGRLGKYEASAKFNYLSKATRDALKAIKDSGQPFLWQPESVTAPEDVYFVHWANPWDEKYMSQNKSAGYEVVMNLKEV